MKLTDLKIGWPPIRRDPSVRTRHLVVIVALTALIAVTLMSFSTSRYLNSEITARGETVENLLLDQIYWFSQEAINLRPLEDPGMAIGLDESVRSLVKASTNQKSDLAYCAIIAPDGRVLALSDERNLLQDRTRIRPFNDLLTSRWTAQLKLLYFTDSIYEITIPMRLSGKPFATLVAGIPGERFRKDISPTLKLGLIFTLIVLLVGALIALTTSNTVLSPLREVMDSIKQLESDIALNPDTRSDSPDLPSVTQRLRELGKRFAGNRTEVETMRDQLKQVVGSLSERVLLLDREQRVLMASPEAERLLGGSSAVALRGRYLAQVLSPSHPLSQMTARAYRTGRSMRQVVTIIGNIAGEHTSQRVAASLQILTDRGHPAGALLTLRDFETLQELETQLDFATKVAALNRITAGVAHEVKNPLHAMVLHLELLSGKLDAGQDPKSHVEILTTEVNRLKRVVQTFLDFTRPVELKLEQVDANVLVREVVLFSTDARAQGIDIVEKYATEPLLIKVDRDILKQALLNIVINGCQVMPDGGRLTLETGRENGHIVMSVTDEGPGIPPEVKDKIFNLYFTTKTTGSGIGLAQAFRAVQLHNGLIKVITKIGAGTTFQIVIPVS